MNPSNSRIVAFLAPLIVLLILGAGFAGAKLALFGTTHSGDYDTYVETAKYIRGEEVNPSTPMTIPQRLLKPLSPLLTAAMVSYMDYKTAFLVQSIFFYFAFIIALYVLAYEFFRNPRLASIVVALSAFSYPLLKYGIDVYTETGALFFYVLSLWLTLVFIRKPTWTLFLINSIVITAGFHWKEYSAVSGAIFGLSVLLHPALLPKAKLLFASTGIAIFLAVSLPIQWYVYSAFQFTFLTWYKFGGATGFTYEFTLKNIVKSTGALLGLAWLLVPFGLMRLQTLSWWNRRFLLTSMPVPMVGYLWGYISSRLLYVIAIPFLLVAVLEMRSWSRTTQSIIVLLIILGNVGWLALSYRVTL